MLSQALNLLASSLILANAANVDLPIWITKGPMSDSTFHYVLCSHDGIDPEEARQIAESKCLASAAKLGGVNVKLTHKTVQSLTGSDSSEVAEIQPIQINIKCEWIDRYLEKIKDGYRVWLRCKVSKKSLTSIPVKSNGTASIELKPTHYAEATLSLSTVPKADRVLIIGQNGERVLEPDSNLLTFKISNSDQKIEVSKIGYKRATILIPIKFKHGDLIEKEAVLEKE